MKALKAKSLLSLLVLLLVSTVACVPGAEVASQKLGPGASAGAAKLRLACMKDRSCVARIAWDKNSEDQEVESYVVSWGPLSKTNAEFSSYEEFRSLGDVSEAVLEGLGAEDTFVTIKAVRGSDSMESDELLIPASEYQNP
jgi:hypothetical protein